MRVPLLLVVMVMGLSSGPKNSLAEEPPKFSPADLFVMKDVTMNVVEPKSTDDDDDDTPPRSTRLQGASIDGSKLNSTQLTDAIVKLIATEMKKAGISTTDLTNFVKNATDMARNDKEDNADSSTERGDDQQTTDQNDSRPPTTDDPELDRGDPDDNGSSDGTKKDDYKEDDRVGSTRYPKSKERINPSGKTGNVFNNGTDFFKWFEDIMKQVEDRMSQNGNTADPIAQDERPGQMDGKATRDSPQQSDRTDDASDDGKKRGNAAADPDSTQHHSSKKHSAKIGRAFSKLRHALRLTWDKNKSSQTQRADDHSDAKSSANSDGTTDFDDWKKSEDDHGGFDNIPKAVPMIVMSGNTYIKDIGNFRNTYQYGDLPVQIRTMEPNGNDSGLDLDTPTEDQKGDETYTRKRLQSAKRDGNEHRVQRLLGMVAQLITIHGHDDGETGDAPVDDAQEPRHESSDDARDNTNQRDPRHDDGNTYHSSVHGHDDGQTYNGDVHGHDDHVDRSSSGDNVHGHDDGQTYNGDSRGHDDHPDHTRDDSVHGHDDGQTYNGAGSSDRRGGGGRSGRGHDDGNTYNPSVHGHDDGSSSRARSTRLQTSRQHDDGNTHRRDEPSGSDTVHGHDDGQTHRPRDSTSGSDDSRGRGHDDGKTHRPRDSSSGSDDRRVHGHDDGQTVMRVSRDVSMTMMNVSLTILGCATVAILVGLFAIARRRRVGVFRRQDYVEV